MMDLLIFDVDGTLAETYGLELLPGVKGFFERWAQAGSPERPRLALATNQGGVGMRYWMETDGFGEPEEFPTAAQVEQRLQALLAILGLPPDLPVYVAYRYLTRDGRWTPAPPEEAGSPRWQRQWRKPGPGMLLQAMQDAAASPERTLFVGDSPEDQGAARAAGCAFRWANEFFR
jgi:HAD superfamily hydrolase (TIGR01662 family)